MRTFTIEDLLYGSKLTSETTTYRCKHCGKSFFIWLSREERENVFMRDIPCPFCKQSSFELHFLQLGLMTVTIDSDLARQLADLSLVKRDLKAAIASCERLLQEILREPQDELLCSAMWSYAVTKYARCFCSGVRAPVNVDSHIKAEQKEMHTKFKDMRDKHFAHSVNYFEQAKVGAVILAPDEGEKRIVDVGVLEYSATYPVDDKLINNLRSLATNVLASVTEEVSKIYASLRQEQELRLNDLYAPKTERLYLVVDQSNPSKKRK